MEARFDRVSSLAACGRHIVFFLFFYLDCTFITFILKSIICLIVYCEVVIKFYFKCCVSVRVVMLRFFLFTLLCLPLSIMRREGCKG